VSRIDEGMDKWEAQLPPPPFAVSWWSPVCGHTGPTFLFFGPPDMLDGNSELLRVKFLPLSAPNIGAFYLVTDTEPVAP
jgi:hypothetical protein